MVPLTGRVFVSARGVSREVKHCATEQLNVQVIEMISCQ